MNIAKEVASKIQKRAREIEKAKMVLRGEAISLAAVEVGQQYGMTGTGVLSLIGRWMASERRHKRITAIARRVIKLPEWHPKLKLKRDYTGFIICRNEEEAHKLQSQFGKGYSTTILTENVLSVDGPGVLLIVYRYR